MKSLFTLILFFAVSLPAGSRHYMPPEATRPDKKATDFQAEKEPPVYKLLNTPEVEFLEQLESINVCKQ